MSNKIKQLEKAAKENSEISKQEKELGQSLKKTVKLELKRAKLMLNLAKRKLETAIARENTAKLNHNLAEKKLNIKKDGIMNIPESDLKIERDTAVYNQKIAENQIKLSKLNKKRADAEKNISLQKLNFAKKILEVAKKRQILSKKQYAYVDALNSGDPERIKKSEGVFLSSQKDLVKARKKLAVKDEEIKIMQTNLANLKNRFVEKEADNEKISPQ